jgi:hypothetical protein
VLLEIRDQWEIPVKMEILVQLAHLVQEEILERMVQLAFQDQLAWLEHLEKEGNLDPLDLGDSKAFLVPQEKMVNLERTEKLDCLEYPE